MTLKIEVLCGKEREDSNEAKVARKGGKERAS